jgi:acetylornithine deacetylase/succinyl-diaminopimelate desuccinylase-like protein
MKKTYIIVVTLAVMILVILAMKEKSSFVEEKENINNPFENPKKEEIPEKITVEEAIAKIDKIDLRRNLEYLSSNELEGRMSGKKGNKLAAEFIRKKFESYGISTEYDKFNIKRVNPGPKNETGDDFTQNIYAWIEGTDSVLKNQVVVVGAHMDHIGYGAT